MELLLALGVNKPPWVGEGVEEEPGAEANGLEYWWEGEPRGEDAEEAPTPTMPPAP